MSEHTPLPKVVAPAPARFYRLSVSRITPGVSCPRARAVLPSRNPLRKRLVGLPPRPRGFTQSCQLPTSPKLVAPAPARFYPHALLPKVVEISLPPRPRGFTLDTYFEGFANSVAPAPARFYLSRPKAIATSARCPRARAVLPKIKCPIVPALALPPRPRGFTEDQSVQSELQSCPHTRSTSHRTHDLSK